MRTCLAAVSGVAMAALIMTIPARAQLLDSLKGAAGIGQSSGSNSGGGLGGALGGLGGGAMPPVGSASSGNIAGVLGFCMRNNYLGGSGAAATESGLLGKLGSGATHGSQFHAGNQGVLETGGGRKFSLSGSSESGIGGGGLKARVTKKVCDQVLSHAHSLI